VKTLSQKIFAQYLFGEMANRPEEHPGVAIGDPQEIKLAKRHLSTARRNFTRSTNMLKGILNEDPNDENVNVRAQAQMSTLIQRFSDLQLSEDEIEILQNKDGAEVDGAHQDQEEIYGRLQASYHSWLTKRVQLPNAAAPFGQPAMQSIVGININVTKMLTEKFSGDKLRK
jgi:hypothetical protein